MEEDRAKKRPLELDWEKLLPNSSQNDDAPPELIVKSSTTTTTATTMGSGDERHEDFEKWGDRMLEEQIERKRRTCETMGPRMPDKGEKLRLTLKRLEDERERRKLARPQKLNSSYAYEGDGCEKPTQSRSLGTVGVSNGFREESTSSQANSGSTFASRLCQKMEENQINCGATEAFKEELSILSHCDRRKMTSKEELSQSRRHRGRSSSKQWSSQRHNKLSKHALLNANKKRRASPSYSLHQNGEHWSSSFAKKKDAFQVHPNGSRHKKEQTVVLIDEDESQSLIDEDESESLEITERVDKLAECMKDAKITYPSRDDPESIEICYVDINCLAPEGYLTSTIMNFYIRYIQLQASPTNRAMCDYHFFNTYFYNKLKEAVSYKGSDKDTYFAKFRRWWKGVNIFQKAYVLIPIHEDLHWSLVIICIPDKEDETGPIILHLDSLRLHSSRSIFENIKSFMKAEWTYLAPEVAPLDLPIADKIWKHLPRRIDDKIIAVPQQKNDSDCGLFVLFFMERFIEKAPERLKRKDLAMFGRQWFKPEEASGLRVKIRKILMLEFKKACDVNCNSESSPFPKGDDPANIDHRTDSD
ncbi:ubiquitin-like-specific protease 1D isoform X5 [Castanea sativa]|uniref:ubiquitin-like-specific protease 1D isoform X5 n=1 Tax=Castanea sativa TaxID=21020 RepID=UPI003F64D9C5